ncbi:MAG: rhomboid family intramembrane serine protease [Bacteroidales bacterium]|nr:rhomboid family intramembrane serine protease [Bacteroidales bacterium]
MQQLTPGVKTILLANIVVFVLGYVLMYMGINMDNYLALYYIKCEQFKPLQFITYMFVHGGLMHIFFNMFALVQFGSIIENVWGTKRFAFYYLFTGVGAAIVNMIVNHYQLHPLLDAANAYLSNPSPDSLMALAHSSNYFDEAKVAQIVEIWRSGQIPESEIIDTTFGQVQELVDKASSRAMVGASGAIFGLLLAFGMMFPNLKLQILFIPVGIPAKYFVVLYGVAELFFGVKGFTGDNIAHFAHLGGMLFGIILLLWWRKNPHNELFN